MYIVVFDLTAVVFKNPNFILDSFMYTNFFFVAFSVAIRVSCYWKVVMLKGVIKNKVLSNSYYVESNMVTVFSLEPLNFDWPLYYAALFYG